LMRYDCSGPEHDHKLFPRPLNAIIDSGNDDPDLVGHLSGDGDRGSGPGSRVTRTGPDFIKSPNFKNLIIVKKRGHSANGLILRRSV
jgi:hypothetical protein